MTRTARILSLIQLALTAAAGISTALRAADAVQAAGALLCAGIAGLPFGSAWVALGTGTRRSESVALAANKTYLFLLVAAGAAIIAMQSGIDGVQTFTLLAMTVPFAVGAALNIAVLRRQTGRRGVDLQAARRAR